AVILRNKKSVSGAGRSRGRRSVPCKIGALDRSDFKRPPQASAHAGDKYPAGSPKTVRISIQVLPSSLRRCGLTFADGAHALHGLRLFGEHRRDERRQRRHNRSMSRGADTNISAVRRGSLPVGEKTVFLTMQEVSLTAGSTIPLAGVSIMASSNPG